MEIPYKWRFLAGKIIHKWAIASMAMLNNVPSAHLLHRYGKWSFIDDLPAKQGDVPSRYAKLPKLPEAFHGFCLSITKLARHVPCWRLWIDEEKSLKSVV
jgi:hypothetical protein